MSLVHIGLDVGSTTVKLVVLNDAYKLIYGSYKRHYSDIRKTVQDILLEGYKTFKHQKITIMVTGSGGLSVNKWLDIPFIQEVVASTKAIQTLIPQTDVAIELGGEDAKITYLGQSLEQRMNSICAGGTGAFIDQMASLLETDAGGLNELARDYTTIYSVASRCGVFAKTDVQALINQGVSREDISVSILQSVVSQTISNLACGRPIKGKVAFLGGPLHFLSELRSRFIETLELQGDDIVYPENSQLYVAIGTAIASVNENILSYESLIERVNKNKSLDEKSIKRIRPLFESQEEYIEFQKRHSVSKIEEIDGEVYGGNAYLGIDAGSTTTKAVLLSEDKKVIYSYYGNNKGKPLNQGILILKDIYEKYPQIKIKRSCVTGYGEEFLKAALKIDDGEVETMAHYKGASIFEPKVDFILDIGGQDMKAIRIRDGIVDDILLNEACSSGCGSFIETFAKSLNISVEEFLKSALFAKNPVDLGSRCTVFMNSMVKQSQKEGATTGDIAAGLAYSVIKNALQKVIKARDPKELGENIIIQGGTFYGDAIVRSFELVSGRQAIRPNLSGLMGALGASIIARENDNGQESTIIKLEELRDFKYETSKTYCKKCGNNCLLTINKFSDGKFITGNRCEKGQGIDTKKDEIPNLFDYKYKRTFNYQPLDLERAKRGIVGIPRVLNIFENYPFWHSFFTELGFSVVLSRESSRKVYERGLASIPSETACYPAKIVHGHIVDLVEKGVNFIFYPSVFYEMSEDKSSDNHLNCPVVTGYPELIKHNMDEIKGNNIVFMNPFISFEDPKSLKNNLKEVLREFKISSFEISNAVKKAYEEQNNYKEDIRREGRKTLDYLEKNNKKGLVLCGRPYHIDGAINHGIPNLINSLDMAVLTEDSIENLGEIKKDELRVLDQWTYHSRLYRSAYYVGQSKNLELIQLNSFGCGLDAVTSDQVQEILYKYGKIYTQLKIDEISNLGAAKIRIRSLKAAIEKKEEGKADLKALRRDENPYKKTIFTQEHKGKHTILMPQMAPIQFKLLQAAVNNYGYNMEILEDVHKEAIDEGLKYVNNDACFPSLLVIGQFISALKSGKYDLNNTSLILTQTGGMCRASNYVGFLRKALKEAGFENIPIISLSAQGIEKNPGFNISLDMAQKCIMSILLGDLLQRVSLRVRPYEKITNSTNILLEQWLDKISYNIKYMDKKVFIQNIEDIIRHFDEIEIVEGRKPRVSIVGEILVKYHPVANNNLVDVLEEEGAEVILSDLTDFLLYCLYNGDFKYRYLGKGLKGKLAGDLGIKYIEYYRSYIREALRESQRFDHPLYIEDLSKLAKQIISLGNQAGEGWLLTAEMMEAIEHGAENIVCVQPFGCLPNHITGKGMIKGIREIYPKANIIPIDYDPGASEVNQINRIKLMLSKAEPNIEIKKDKIKFKKKFK